MFAFTAKAIGLASDPTCSFQACLEKAGQDMEKIVRDRR
jgi:hypothetical protein